MLRLMLYGGATLIAAIYQFNSYPNLHLENLIKNSDLIVFGEIPVKTDFQCKFNFNIKKILHSSKSDGSFGKEIAIDFCRSRFDRNGFEVCSSSKESRSWIFVIKKTSIDGVFRPAFKFGSFSKVIGKKLICPNFQLIVRKNIRINVVRPIEINEFGNLIKNFKNDPSFKVLEPQPKKDPLNYLIKKLKINPCKNNPEYDSKICEGFYFESEIKKKQ